MKLYTKNSSLIAGAVALIALSGTAAQASAVLFSTYGGTTLNAIPSYNATQQFGANSFSHTMTPPGNQDWTAASFKVTQSIVNPTIVFFTLETNPNPNTPPFPAQAAPGLVNAFISLPGAALPANNSFPDGGVYPIGSQYSLTTTQVGSGTTGYFKTGESGTSLQYESTFTYAGTLTAGDSYYLLLDNLAPPAPANPILYDIYWLGGTTSTTSTYTSYKSGVVSGSTAMFQIQVPEPATPTAYLIGMMLVGGLLVFRRKQPPLRAC